MKNTINLSIFANLERDGVVDLNVSLPADARADELIRTFVRLTRVLGCDSTELRNALFMVGDELPDNENQPPLYMPDDWWNSLTGQVR